MPQTQKIVNRHAHADRRALVRLQVQKLHAEEVWFEVRSPFTLRDVPPHGLSFRQAYNHPILPYMRPLLTPTTSATSLTIVPVLKHRFITITGTAKAPRTLNPGHSTKMTILISPGPPETTLMSKNISVTYASTPRSPISAVKTNWMRAKEIPYKTSPTLQMSLCSSPERTSMRTLLKTKTTL